MRWPRVGGGAHLKAMVVKGGSRHQGVSGLSEGVVNVEVRVSSGELHSPTPQKPYQQYAEQHYVTREKWLCVYVCVGAEG